MKPPSRLPRLETFKHFMVAKTWVELGAGLAGEDLIRLLSSVPMKCSKISTLIQIVVANAAGPCSLLVYKVNLQRHMLEICPDT